jgi:hypothetical protein
MRARHIFFVLVAAVFILKCSSQEQDGPAYPISERIELAIETKAPATSAEDMTAFIDSLPDADVPAFDETMATGLAALPLSCIDRIHSQSDYEGYLYARTTALRPTFEDSLAFYGCYDWHSAVNSTWTMIRLHKEFPDLYVGKLIREKLSNHLSEGSMAGEHHFFEEIASEGFERPYGWAWLMKVYTELATWDDPDAQEWVAHVRPLTDLFSERTIEYLNNLSHPMREGTHGNTAFSLSFMLEYARLTEDDRLEEAIVRRAKDLYLRDTNCPTHYEPSGSDFLSPCLAQAELMSRILTRTSFGEWLDTFLPPVYAPSFASLVRPVEGGEGYLSDLIEASDEGNGTGPDEERTGEKSSGEEDEEDTLQGAKSHLIGLAFHRAAALRIIASALPDDDSRIEAYRQIADLNAAKGFEAMFDVDYVGTHWLGTFAVYYLTAPGASSTMSGVSAAPGAGV